MIKALMVITMVSGSEYTAKLPSMDECLKQVNPVVQQNDVESAACIPRSDNTLEAKEKMKSFFSMFDNIIKNMPNESHPANPSYPGTLNCEQPYRILRDEC